jgi:hypothetical protein
MRLSLAFDCLYIYFYYYFILSFFLCFIFYIVHSIIDTYIKDVFEMGVSCKLFILFKFLFIDICVIF